MKKKLLFLFIFISLRSLSSLAETVEVEGIFYNINSSSIEAEVSKNPNKYSGDVIIPAKFSYRGKRYKVTAIGEHAFRLCDKLTSVVLPNSIISIEGCAFCDSENLKSVLLSGNLKSIKQEAFNGCKKLDNIQLPKSLTVIDVGAFAYCESLSSIIIPQNVEDIGPRAFACCTSLRSIKVDEANKYYDSRYDCNAIIRSSNRSLVTGCASTIIPKDIWDIGDCAFDGCKDLKYINIPDGVTTINRGAFTWSGLSSVDIPNSVKHIGEYAFQSCNNLLSVTIPESVTIIENVAFSSCDSLQSVSFLGNSVHIGRSAFADCPLLKDVYIHSPNKMYYISDDAFENCYYPSVLHVQKEVLKKYREDDKWDYSFDDIVAIGYEEDSYNLYLLLGISLIFIIIALYKKKNKG